MMTIRQILFSVLVLALTITVIPVLRRMSPVPCSYMWRYAISYSEPPTNYIDPSDVYPGYPAFCRDLVQNSTQYL